MTQFTFTFVVVCNHRRRRLTTHPHQRLTLSTTITIDGLFNKVRVWCGQRVCRVSSLIKKRIRSSALYSNTRTVTNCRQANKYYNGALDHVFVVSRRICWLKTSTTFATSLSKYPNCLSANHKLYVQTRLLPLCAMKCSLTHNVCLISSNLIHPCQWWHMIKCPAPTAKATAWIWTTSTTISNHFSDHQDCKNKYHQLYNFIFFSW